MPVISFSGRQLHFTRAFLAAILGTFIAGSVAAQDTPRDVRMKAQLALSQGAFSDAIRYLQQLVDFFGESKRETTAVQMETVYYSLATCHFFLGQFAEAREVFATYLKKYRTGAHAVEVAVYIGDCHRFEGRLPEALKAYLAVLKKPDLNGSLKADVYMAMARCYLAQDKWDKAMPVLRKLYQVAPDPTRRSWAATLLTTAYLKERNLERVYRLMPYLLAPNSFATRSVALNMAALEAGDDLFANEQYRDALWVYRLVNPHDVIAARSQQYLEILEKKAERLRKLPESPRDLMRVQESIGELENEIKALETLENYDIELFFRMARAYMEIRRFREGRDLFLHLHDEAPEPKANEALYLAFQCAVRLQPWQQALDIGGQYMEKYPAGEYYDDVSVLVGQIHAKQEDWPSVISVLTKALEVSPNHSQAAECMYLIGYASFMEENYTNSVAWLRKMNDRFPGNPREADGIYWTGMGLLFDRQFEQAAVEFDAIMSRFPDSIYIQDATFRRATCEFGLSRFATAEPMLQAFVGRYPDHKLCGEAFMMLGDVSAALGELQKAVARYQQVPRYEINIEFYNHCAFRCGEILEELNDFKGVVDHFQAYIRANRPGSNLPLAMFWVGKAMWAQGEHRGAMEFFREGIATYGVNRKELGIDLILEEWIGRSRSAESEVSRGAWKDMEALLAQAEKNGQTTLALRLKRVFLFAPDITPERKQALMADLMNPGNLTNASPGVLEIMLDEARRTSNTAFAVRIAETMVRDFTETDYALSARMVLAQVAIERKDYPTAIRHLTVIREVFASSAEAAEALMLLGDLYIRQNRITDADECYKSVLGVREWRGPLWPAALYGRGECARLRGNYEQAAAYYERIYVMYSQYRDWAAKAYLARAGALVRLRQYQKAIETLTEMIGLEDLKNTPEAPLAVKQLEELRRQGS